MDVTKTAFIVGGGPNVGASLASALAQKGYQVAVGRRSSVKDISPSPNITALQVDVSNPQNISAAFTRIKTTIGIPNVVIYNAYSHENAGPLDDPFSASIDTLIEDNKSNIVGVYTAIQEAVAGWNTLAATNTDPKVFIVTGNIFPWMPDPRMIGIGAGKAAAAFLMHVASKTEAFRERGYRFYFASEVTEEGGPQYHGISGGAHARKYLDLIGSKEQLAWEVRFKPSELL